MIVGFKLKAKQSEKKTVIKEQTVVGDDKNSEEDDADEEITLNLNANQPHSLDSSDKGKNTNCTLTIYNDSIDVYLIIYNGELINDNIEYVLHKCNITINCLRNNIISVEYTNENFEIIRVQCHDDANANAFVNRYKSFP